MRESLYLVNYRHKGAAPLKSITRLNREDALRVAAELYKSSQCNAHRRFGADFPSYVDFRLKTEKWLYESFIALGGKPVVKHPLYFALERCDSLKRNFENGEELRIPLDEIDERYVSFTYGDSVAISEKPDSRKPVFTKTELCLSIASAGSIEKFIETAINEYRCVEAQLWNDAYAERALKALSD